MPARKLKIGVTGLGRIGWEHVKALAAHRDFALAAVADPLAARCEEARARYGCAVFSSHDQLAKSGRVDAVVIASPTHLHKPMCRQACAAGLHVFLEKPMAPSVADAVAIARAARRARRVLTVYQPHRAAAYHQQLRRLIRSGKLGDIYHVRRGSFTWVRRNDWQTLRQYGGGMLMNFGAHFIDQLFDLTGADVHELFCRLGRVATLGDAEDVVKIVYRTRDRVLGEIDINQASPRAPYELEVYGTRGTLWMQDNVLHLRYFRPRDLARRRLDAVLASPNREYPREQVAFREESHPVDTRLQIDVYADFARAIRTGAAPFVKPSETLAVMRLIERCRRADGGQNCRNLAKTA